MTNNWFKSPFEDVTMNRAFANVNGSQYKKMVANHFIWNEESEKILKGLTKNSPKMPQVNIKEIDKMVNIQIKKLRKNSKVKLKFIEACSKPSLEKAVDEFLAGDIKLVDWEFDSYDGYYMFTCTYQELSSLD